jgi:hypothetical protein
LGWLKTKTHRDGSVSYFSDAQKRWIENVRTIPQKELEKMTLEEQQRMLKYLKKHN